MRDISNQLKKALFYTMCKIRRFEEKLIELYPTKEIKTPIHLCIGQEAIAAGVCLNLKKDDHVFSNHRNHGHYIAKGADIKLLMAEHYGKVTGCSKGRGGSMHPVAVECGMPGTSAIVGGCIALAVGTSFASRYKRDKKVSVVFFGDGAADEGIFHESLNFASLKRLPVVFICENNFYATHSHISIRQPHDDIAKRAEGYNIPAIRVNGNKVIDVYKITKKAVREARAGKGPTLIECRTYRWSAHVGIESDYEKGYRPKEEFERWRKECPVEIFKKELLKTKVISDSEFENMIGGIDREIDSALDFAKKSDFPEEEGLLKYVYYTKE